MHAGNIIELFSCSFVFEAHPRACGEYREVTYETMQRLGSPPRMRGISLSHKAGEIGRGLTPAHAGNIVQLEDRVRRD